MLSIDNTYSADELREFDRRVRKRGLETDDLRYLVDPKIDGVAVALRYEAGQLVLGATRGDGRTGDDITQNLRTIRSVPLRAPVKTGPRVLEVRGEVYWPRDDFERVNQRTPQAAGQEPFKNPRNATAGTLKQLDPAWSRERGLAFHVPRPTAVTPARRRRRHHEQLLDQLRTWGMPTSPHPRVCESIDDGRLVRRASGTQQRHELDYETDGLVVKVDAFAQRRNWARTARRRAGASPTSSPPSRPPASVLSVDLQVGKLGTITPVANLEPVQLAGTTVKRASLHNFDQVARLDLHVGDTSPSRKPARSSRRSSRRRQRKRPECPPSTAPPPAPSAPARWPRTRAACTCAASTRPARRRSSSG
jgi:DNA ligase (NAD+)